MKFFISQRMSGLSEEEIFATKERIIKEITKKYGKDCEIINSYIREEEKFTPLYGLGLAITILSKADFAVFAENWENSRGCNIERECCYKYGITIIDENELTEV